jgi:type I restriction enzyme, S subunit
MSELPTGWVETKLGDILQLEYGKSLIKGIRNNDGGIPVLGSSGNIGYHNQFLVSGPVIIVGRKGDVGKIYFCDIKCWPIDTTYYIKPSNNLSINLIYHLLKALKLDQYDKSTAIPGLNRNDVYSLKIKLPPSTNNAA